MRLPSSSQEDRETENGSAPMSTVNIKRVVENIRANTTVYTPIVDVVVNAIQAIGIHDGTGGKIVIRAERDQQLELDGGLPDIIGFYVEDNGVGFTNENRDAFDDLYTDYKITEGGKGFGRFIFLKYFESVHVDSVYWDDGCIIRRTFSMGKDRDIIINETFSAPEECDSGTIVHLSALKKRGSLDKKLNTLARNLVERLLPYFITEGYICPSIVLSEKDGSQPILLNAFVNNELSAFIRELHVDNGGFTLKGNQIEEEFLVRVFRLYFPKNQKSKISLVAHKREVSGSPPHKYIPEFSEEFYDKSGGGEDHERNYIVKAYVFSGHLNRTVSLERSGYEFQMENDTLFGISQTDIESRAAEIAKDAMGYEITVRQEKKRSDVQSYVEDEAPWFKHVVSTVDLTSMPYNPSHEDINTRLQKDKFEQEVRIKRDVKKLLAEGYLGGIKDKDVAEIVSKISETSKGDLVHYIALRRKILDIFGKSLEIDTSGVYSSEGVVHDIIFPRKRNTDTLSYEDHNLWMIDERLNFATFVSSDETKGRKRNRVDLLVYNKRISFRGDNEASNPITIFEFKKPKRDDFVNRSAREDPVAQIVRYVNDIKVGKYDLPNGRKMILGENTPFFGYVVCDLTSKVEKWLDLEKNFKPMPDRMGWFYWNGNINLYVEVLSWDKVLKDAQMRNKIFFHKLGI